MAEYAHEKRDNSQAKEESPARLLTAQNIYIVYTQYLRKLYANLTHLCVNFCKIQYRLKKNACITYELRMSRMKFSSVIYAQIVPWQCDICFLVMFFTRFIHIPVKLTWIFRDTSVISKNFA